MRKKRENIDAETPLDFQCDKELDLSSIDSTWTEWKVVMKNELRFSCAGGDVVWERREENKGYRVSIRTLRKMFPKRKYEHGLYEIMARRLFPYELWDQCRLVDGRPDNVEDILPVYLGVCARKKNPGIYQRINEYCRDGSHIKKFIEEALEKNYELLFRVKFCHHKDAQVMEKCLLKRYDYAWNEKENGEKRHILAYAELKNGHKFVREHLDDSDCLISEWQWSTWQMIIAPGKLDRRHERFKNRKSVGICIRKTKLTEMFPEANNKNGIFELMLKRDTSVHVVYVGCTFKGSTCDLIDRIYDFCNGESTKESLIQDALDKQYCVCARIRRSGSNTKTAAEKDENILLDMYDYVWNLRRNARVPLY